VRDVLIRTYHHHAPRFPIDAAHVENVTDSLVIDAEDLFVVLQAKLAGLRF
jgi:hypothetical protein